MSAADPRSPVHAQALEGAAEGSGTREAVSEAQRAELAVVIHNAACQCRGHATGLTLRSRDVDAMADAVLAAGFRRVAEDPETAQTLDDVARDIRSEASIAARAGQLDRLENAAERVEAVAAVLFWSHRHGVITHVERRGVRCAGCGAEEPAS